MIAIVPQDKPPKVRLSLDPVVASLQDVGVGFEELHWLDSAEETVTAADDQQIRLIKAESQKQLLVKVDGREVTFADRRKALLEAMQIWADDNREIVLADSGGKTRKFTHGELSWKKQPLRIDFAQGRTSS